MLGLVLAAILVPTLDAADTPPNSAALEQQVQALSDEGKFAEALPLAKELLALREKQHGPDDLATMKAVLQLAWLHDDAGEPDAALPLFQRAVATLERTRGAVDEEVATARNGLGALHHSQGRLLEARAEWLRVLAITEKAPGLESFAAVRVLGNLAALHYDLDDPAQSDAYYRRALTTAEKILGPEHRATLMVLGNYGNFLFSIGDFSRAEEYLRDSLARRRKVVGEEHPMVAEAVFNLASNALLAKRYPEAEKGFRASLVLMEKTAGADSPRTARVLSALAEVLSHDRSDEAAALAARALEIQEKKRGPNHRDVAEALRDAAAVELRRAGGAKEPARVEAQLRRALEIYEGQMGSANRNTVGALDKLAIALHRAGKKDEAREMARRALRGKEAILASVLSFAPESQRLAYQALADFASVPAALGEAELLAEAILRTEAVVLDSLLEDRRVLAASADPAVRARVEQARDLRARLRLAQAAPLGPEREQQVRALTAEFEREEIALTRSVAALGRARRALSTELNAVRAALPAGSALIEYVRYRDDSAAGARESASYGAVVIPPTGEAVVRWIPLGPAGPIEQEIRQLQRGVAPKGQPLEAELAASVLHRLVWERIAKTLPDGTRRVLIAPDGDLHSISFAALAGKGGRFVAEDFAIAYLSAGRDLLVAAPRVGGGKPTLLVVANPKFERAAVAAPVVASAGAGRAGEGAAYRNLDFGPLPGAEAEARALLERARQAGWSGELLTGAEATKAALFARVRAPRLLHLATHGFYLSTPKAGPVALADPMWRSGVALAGATETMSAWLRGEASTPTGEGIVTAAEAADLDLRGTWLVTLSACESGLGEARVGEGVLGLRRGLALAGAQHLLVTLWPVPDRETGELMRDFYAAALTGDPAAALAEVQRKALVRLRGQGGVGRAVRSAGAFILSSHVGVR